MNRFNAKKFFKMTGEIKTGFKPQTKIIEYDTEMLITKEKQIIGNFKEYFNCLHNWSTTEYDSDLNID